MMEWKDPNSDPDPQHWKVRYLIYSSGTHMCALVAPNTNFLTDIWPRFFRTRSVKNVVKLRKEQDPEILKRQVTTSNFCNFLSTDFTQISVEKRQNLGMLISAWTISSPCVS